MITKKIDFIHTIEKTYAIIMKVFVVTCRKINQTKMSRRARRRESPRRNDSRPTIPFSVPDNLKNIDDRPTRGKYY